MTILKLQVLTNIQVEASCICAFCPSGNSIAYNIPDCNGSDWAARMMVVVGDSMLPALKP